MITIRIRVDALDKLFSEFVRKRAVLRVGGCEKCLRPHEWSELQCSHFFGRGDKSTRWDESNCVGICFFCHNDFTGHPLEHTQWFQGHLGKEQFEMLEGRNRNTWPRPDKKLLALYYQEQIRRLK